MAYIIKNTTGLINTRVTDAGRRKMSQGNFVIRYFQVGDSEICYDCITGYNHSDNYIFEPCFNSHNSTAAPENNKQYVKYPIYVDTVSGNTYGIPFMDSTYDSVFNAAAPRGFFSGSTGLFQKIVLSSHTLNPNFLANNLNVTGTNIITLNASTCDPNPGGTAVVGDFITIYFGDPNCTTVNANYQSMTYRITGGTAPTFQLDRNLPNYAAVGGAGRVFMFPSGLTPYYDSYTPSPHWYDDVIDFESVCTTDAFDVKIWNMNIPWTETPAGINTGVYVDYTGFGSRQYIGSKEYLGYNSFSGHTVFDTGSTIQPNAYYFDSFSNQVNVDPSEQKAIAIVHYTNNTIDYFYGEKFALQPYDPTNPANTIGVARNFKVSLPWLAWHKANVTPLTDGQTFYVDPPGFASLNLFVPYYIQSNINDDMNDKGIRYYNLWDINPNINGYPNRVGKVFPDQKIIVFDDEEIIAAMSYKANRSWTLPAPTVSLVTPNICSGSTATSSVGILSADTQYMYITYRLDNSVTGVYSLHCNYYRKIQGPSSGCTLEPQNVAVRFGDEFPYMNMSTGSVGFQADNMSILCQVVSGDTRPDPFMWKQIDVTAQLQLVGSYIDPTSIVTTTFVINEIDYDAAPFYELDSYINLTLSGETGTTLNFGDEYYFYGVIETDIQATIYEMRYQCNLSQAEFTNSSNPTWSNGNDIYVTEIGLFDEDKDLLVMSKLQSPVKRLGIQQLLVKFDF